jgi:hypothetical protein
MRAIYFIILGYIVLALSYSVINPLGEAPDEVSHYAYARYVGRERALPPPEGAARGEVFQPPLYYALVGLATGWIEERDFTIKANNDFSLAEKTPNVLLHTRQEAFPYRGGALAWHLMRALSVAMGAVTVWSVYALARVVFASSQALPIAVAAFTAFMPEFLFITSAVNNDNLTAMLSALTLLLLARLVTGASDGARAWLSVGVLLGLGVWTKMSMLAFVPLAGVAALIVARRRGASLARLSVWIALPALVVAAPWLVRNWLTCGDPLGWAVMRQVTDAMVAPMGLAEYPAWLWSFFQSFWGRFGGAIHVQMPALVYIALGVLTLVAFTGFWRSSFVLRPSSFVFRLSSSCLLTWFLALHLALIALLLIVWANTNQGTDQARLAYPALAAINIFLVAGLAAWIPAHRHELLARVMSGGMFAFGAIVLFVFLLPLYSPSPRLSLDAVPFSVRRGAFDFGGQLRLLGWEIERGTLAPGETTYLTMYWQALTDPREDYWLFLRLEGANDDDVWSKDGTPLAGRDSTDVWRKGDVIAARHRITLGDNVAPGRYRLLAGVHRFGAWEWLPIFDENGRAVGDVVMVGEVFVNTR